MSEETMEVTFECDLAEVERLQREVRIDYVVIQEPVAHQCVVVKLLDGEAWEIAGPVFRTEITSGFPKVAGMEATFDLRRVAFRAGGWDDIRELTKNWWDCREYSLPC